MALPYPFEKEVFEKQVEMVINNPTLCHHILPLCDNQYYQRRNDMWNKLAVMPLTYYFKSNLRLTQNNYRAFWLLVHQANRNNVFPLMCADDVCDIRFIDSALRSGLYHTSHYHVSKHSQVIELFTSIINNKYITQLKKIILHQKCKKRILLHIDMYYLRPNQDNYQVFIVLGRQPLRCFELISDKSRAHVESSLDIIPDLANIIAGYTV
jgi:hypothetical protein